MQPLQYDLRSSAAKDNGITHAAAVQGNFDAAITMRFAASRRYPASLYADGNTRWQQSCSHSDAICNQVQETHRTTHTGTTTRCRTQMRNQFAHETTAAAPVAHTRYLSSPAAATLHGKTQGFVLRLPPRNIAHATFTCIVRSRTTLHDTQLHSFLFFCYVLSDHAPPFIIGNSIASYSFVMYCYVMLCIVLLDHAPPFIIVHS